MSANLKLYKIYEVVEFIGSTFYLIPTDEWDVFTSCMNDIKAKYHPVKEQLDYLAEKEAYLNHFKVMDIRKDFVVLNDDDT